MFLLQFFYIFLIYLVKTNMVKDKLISLYAINIFIAAVDLNNFCYFETDSL